MPQIKIVSFKIFISIVFLLCYSGCSDKNKNPTVNLIIHTEKWITDHSTGYLSYTNGCTNCHGNKCNGGNADVNCFSASYKGISCHEQHPAGWKDFKSHGYAALMDTATYGFSRCRKCHGSEENKDFSGGIVNVSCYTCHGISAPHPRAPWNDTGNVDTTNTSQTRPIHHKGQSNPVPVANLYICLDCHVNGQYSRKKPDTTKTVGTEPGCSNNTICHSKRW